MASYLDSIYKKKPTGFLGSILDNIESNSGSSSSSWDDSTAMTGTPTPTIDPNYPLTAATFNMNPGGSPISQAYQSIIQPGQQSYQFPNDGSPAQFSAPTGAFDAPKQWQAGQYSSGGKLGATPAAGAGFSTAQGSAGIQAPTRPGAIPESPAMAAMRKRREAAVGDLTARRMEGSTALMPTGGLERGGRINEAKAFAAQQDFNDRLNQLAQRNAFQALADGPGRASASRSNRGGGGDRYQRGGRINARAMPAAETVDQKFQRALGERDDIVEQTAAGRSSVKGTLGAGLDTLEAQRAEAQRLEEERRKRGY